MKFNKEAEVNFKSNPTPHRLKEVLEDRHAAAQEVVNSIKEDHRYYQGYLRAIKELKVLLAEAMNQS